MVNSANATNSNVPLITCNINTSGSGGIRATAGSVKEKDNKHNKNIGKISSSSKTHDKDAREKTAKSSKGSNKDQNTTSNNVSMEQSSSTSTNVTPIIGNNLFHYFNNSLLMYKLCLLV